MQTKSYRIVLGLLFFLIACHPASETQETTSPPFPVTSSAQPPTLTSEPILGEIVAEIRSGPMPGGILAVGKGAVWVPNAGNGTVARIDPATNQVTATIEIGEVGGSYGSPLAVAVSGAAVWVTDNAGFALVRIDPIADKVVATIPLERFIAGTNQHAPVEPYYLSATDQDVWVTALDFDTILRIDPQTNEIVASLRVPSPSGIAVSDEAIWASNHRQGTLSRIDPDTNELIATIDVSVSRPEALAIGEGGVWVTDSASGVVTRIDPETNQVLATIRTAGTSANGITIGGGAVWVTSLGGRLTRIDPQTNQVAGTLRVGAAVGVAFGEGSLWVGDIMKGSVLRITPFP